MTKLDTPSNGHEYFRELFEKKNISQKSSGSEKEKLDYILNQLDEAHRKSVLNYNKGLQRTFGSILLAVNYSDSQLIDRLGGGSLGSVDTQDGAIAFIMGYSESVQGHGVRYLCEYGVFKDGKIVSSSPLTYRGAYASEKDHRYRAYNEIKILETKDGTITFGVKSNQQLLIHQWKIDKSYFETLNCYNLAEEERVLQEKKLLETLTANRKENLDNICNLISKKTSDLENVENPFVTESYAIFPIIRHDRPYDATDIDYQLYIVGDQFPEPHKFHKGTFKYGGHTYGRFFRNSATLSFETLDQNTLKLHINYSGNYKVRSEDQVIHLPTPKK